MSSLLRICDAGAAAAAPRDVRALVAGFSSLPQSLLQYILMYLPLDDRVRSAAVHPAWNAALAHPGMWSVLDLSREGATTPSRISNALVRGVLKRANGQLKTLVLVDFYYIEFPSILYIVKESPALRDLVLQQHHEREGELAPFYGNKLGDIETVLRAAPELEVLHADLSLGFSRDGDFDAALEMLRREERFRSLRLGHLIISLEDAHSVLKLVAELPRHSETLKGLELHSTNFDEWPGALDAVVTATLASRLASLVLYECELGPVSAQALPRLLSGTSLTSLRIACEDRTQLLDENAAVLLANALSVNSTLTSLAFTAADLWCLPAAGAALFASLVAHPSLRSFIWRERYRCEHQKPVGLALQALLAANAPALRHLEVFGGLEEDGLGPFLDALPRNTHLRRLDFCTSEISHSFARDRLLPAVRANMSLRRLFDEEYVWTSDEGVEQVLLEAFELVNSRGGMPADERN